MRSTEPISSPTTVDRSARSAPEQTQQPALGGLSPASAILLQRSAGNRAVAHLILSRAPAQQLEHQVLSDQQKRVLADAQGRAAKSAKKARKGLLAKIKAFGMTETDLEVILRHVRASEMTVNIDASKNIASLNKTVAELLEESGKLKGRFETGTSGGDTGFKGREAVERNLFGYAQITEESPMSEKAERPKYAAPNLTTSAGGAADTSTYGLSSLVLNEAAKQRMTLTSTDTFSITDPSQVGTFEHIEAVLLERFNQTDGKTLAETILAHATGGRGTTTGFGYMEAQIHGEVDLERDVAYVRASFNEGFGAKAGEALRRIADTKPVIWGYYKERDQMVLQPTRGPAKAAFDRIWNEVETLRKAKGDAGTPIPTGLGHPEMKAKWKELLKAMPPANIEVTDPSKSQYGQITGRGASDRLPNITKAELLAL
jgi:hypothetical protein